MSNPSDYYKLAKRAVDQLTRMADAAQPKSVTLDQASTADLARELAARGSTPEMRALGEVLVRSAPNFDTPEAREAVRRALGRLGRLTRLS